MVVRTDSNNQIVELNNEDNNTTIDDQIISISVAPQPDLVVSAISAPSGSFSGQAIELIWVVTNQGEAEATGTWNDRIFLTQDDLVGGDQSLGSFAFTGTIAAGESIERRQAVTLPIDVSGDRTFIVTTDAFNQLTEFGFEDNNTSVDDQVISVELSPLPNLQVTSVNTPATAFSSRETVIEWIVTNNGTGATSAPTCP